MSIRMTFTFCCIEIEADENDGETDEGTYFVDQAGHYYYQAKGESQPIMTMVSEINENEDEGEEFIINQENCEDGAEDEVSLRIKILVVLVLPIKVYAIIWM